MEKFFVRRSLKSAADRPLYSPISEVAKVPLESNVPVITALPWVIENSTESPDLLNVTLFSGGVAR